MRKKVAIIHFYPIEYFPPITNLLNHISNYDDIKVDVYTCHNTKNRIPFRNDKLNIIEKSGGDYKTAMTDYLKEWKNREELNQKRVETGGKALKNAVN